MSEITEVGIDIFNYLMSFVQGILFLNPMEFRDGGLWDAVVEINLALLPVSSTIVIISFLLSLYDENLADINKSTVFRYGLRFCFAVAISVGCSGVVSVIILFGNWVAHAIVSILPGASIQFQIPDAVIDALNNISIFDPSTFTTITPRIAIQIVFFLICVGSAVIIAIAVFTRLFKLCILGALAPIPLAFAGAGSGHELGRIPGRFVTNFLGQSLQVAIIWVLLIFYGLIMNNSINFVASNAHSELFIIILWMVETVIYMVILVGSIRGADRLSSQLGFG